MAKKYDANKLRAFYAQDAARRDASEKQAWKLTERERFLDELRAADAKTLLELGAGPGHDSRFFADAGLQVTATDLSPEMVELCRAKGLNARVVDYRQLEFPDASFGAIYALNSLLHTPKEQLPAILSGIRRVMKPGGLFYLGVWGGNDFEGILEKDNFEPKRFFSYWQDRALLELVTAYFDLIYFRRVAAGKQLDHHFQSMMLRKGTRLATTAPNA